MMRTAPLQDRSQGQRPLSLHSSCPRVPVFGLKRDAFFRTGAQKETVSRFGAGAAENWPVIWFGLEYALTVDVGRCGHGDR